MKRVLSAIVIGLMAFSLSMPLAHADGAEVTRTGRGTLGSVWKLELDREARIEVDFDVNSTRAGHTWRILMRHNGIVFFTGTRVTDHEGEFEVDRVVRNFAGLDTIRVRAVDQRNGELVRAVASIR